MDPITHGLFGATIAQLGFRQRIGRGTTVVAVLAAMLPDVDILIPRLSQATGIPLGPFREYLQHRGLTHSALFVPFMALAVAAAWAGVRFLARRTRASGVGPSPGAPESPPDALPPQPPDSADKPKSAGFGWLLALCLLALYSHLLLDTFTSYGTELLSPLSRRRFAVNALPIVDVFFMAILVLTLTACILILRKAAPWARKAALAVAWTGLGLSLLYMATGAMIGERLAAQAKAALATGDAAAYPQIPSILVWRVTARTDHFWYAARQNVLLSPPLTADRFNRAANEDHDTAVTTARELAEVREFYWFADGQVRPAVARVGQTQTVTFDDMRYGYRADSLESMWSFQVTLDAACRVLAARQTHRLHDENRAKMAGRVWQEMWHG